LGLAPARPARQGVALTELTYTVEALLFVASGPLTVDELAAAAEAPPERIERALDALGARHGEGRSGVVLERVAGGYALRAAAECATACARLLDRDVDRPLSQAALETLAIIAYAGPVSRPEIARIRGVAADAGVAALQERGLIEEAGRARTPGGAVLYRTTTLFDRIFGLADGRASLPPIEELADAEAGPDALRDRLVAVAAQRS
jgi:segregation and condensation protein B